MGRAAGSCEDSAPAGKQRIKRLAYSHGGGWPEQGSEEREPGVEVEPSVVDAGDIVAGRGFEKQGAGELLGAGGDEFTRPIVREASRGFAKDAAELDEPDAGGHGYGRRASCRASCGASVRGLILL